MQMAVVVGHAVATVKHASMRGWRLLVVQPVTAAGEADGEPLLAIDHLGAGVGAPVLLTNDGAAVREFVGQPASPLRWMVIGLPNNE